MTARLLVLYNPPVDSAAFDTYYTETHVPLAKKVPGLSGIAYSDGPINSPDGPSPYYRIGTLAWASMAELQTALATPEGIAAATDVSNFASGGAAMLIFEERDA